MTWRVSKLEPIGT